MAETTLVHFSRARAELAKATQIDEVKEIRDKAEALRAYLKQQGESLETQNQCAEITIRAERRAGELLLENPPQGERKGRPKKVSCDSTPFVTLENLGLTRDQSSQWQKIGAMEEPHFEAYLTETKGARKELTTAGTLRAAKGLNLHFSSDNIECYTPADIVSRAQAAMGRIDLDPCSNSRDEPNIPAEHHFTEEDDGLSRGWDGRVYMNPPYGRVLPAWVKHLCGEYDARRTIEAIALVPSRTDTLWFRALREYPRCFIWGRLKFVGQENSAPFPSMVVYLGDGLDRFCKAFSDIGDIYVLGQ